MKIELLQHVPFEGPGLIRSWADTHAHVLHPVALYRGAPPLPLSEIDLLIIMGGPMSSSDEARYPWLGEEKKHLREALEADMPILGICLGAQLLAEALGAAVTRNPEKEIGWFPVERVSPPNPSWLHQGLPPRFEVFHWHGETFNVPDGAQPLARSAACENQAFIYRDRVVALQFHLEMLPHDIQRIIDHSMDDLVEAGTWVQDPTRMLQKTFSAQNRAILFGLLDGLAAQAGGGR